MDRVLDLLHKVKYEQDGTLTFRRSCAHGVCGSDAMLINGRNRLACKIRVDQLGGKKITVAPLPGPAGDQGPRRRHGGVLREVPERPAVPAGRRARARRASGSSRRPSRRALRRHDQVHPVRRVHVLVPVVLGAAVVRRAGRDRQRPPVHLRLRDDGAEERLEILADKDGVWRCRTIFNCTDACPRGIHITQAILEVSSAIVERRGLSADGAGGARPPGLPRTSSSGPTARPAAIPGPRRWARR